MINGILGIMFLPAGKVRLTVMRFGINTCMCECFAKQFAIFCVYMDMAYNKHIVVGDLNRAREMFL